MAAKKKGRVDNIKSHRLQQLI